MKVFYLLFFSRLFLAHTLRETESLSFSLLSLSFSLFLRLAMTQAHGEIRGPPPRAASPTPSSSAGGCACSTSRTASGLSRTSLCARRARSTPGSVRDGPRCARPTRSRSGRRLCFLGGASETAAWWWWPARTAAHCKKKNTNTKTRRPRRVFIQERKSFFFSSLEFLKSLRKMTYAAASAPAAAALQNARVVRSLSLSCF